jgi:hypothetical protein
VASVKLSSEVWDKQDAIILELIDVQDASYRLVLNGVCNGWITTTWWFAHGKPFPDHFLDIEMAFPDRLEVQKHSSPRPGTLNITSLRASPASILDDDTNAGGFEEEIYLDRTFVTPVKNCLHYFIHE